MAKAQPSAKEYGQSLSGLGFNLLVKDLTKSMAFATQVVKAKVLFATQNFAAMQLQGRDYMYHQDETYRSNPLYGSLTSSEARGIGIELHCYGTDPDTAEQAAREGGWTVLAGSLDKPHGLREAMILDDDGYIWVPSVHLK